MNAKASYLRLIADAARDALEAEAKAARAYREKTNRLAMATAATVDALRTMAAGDFVKQPALDAAAHASAIASDVNAAAMLRLGAAERNRIEANK